MGYADQVAAYEEMQRKCREYDSMVAKLRVATEALEYYAEKSNWVSRSGKIGICPIDTEDREAMGHDSYKQEYPWAGGKKAREALAKIREEPRA